MPKGRYPFHFATEAGIDRPAQEIYADVDAYTMEYFEDEPAFHQGIDFVVVLPPLIYEGQRLKAIFWSQAVDFLDKRFPQLSELFFSVANAQCRAIPWSRRADGLFLLYPNPDREAWFRNTHSERAQQVLIPMQDADQTHEYKMAPVPEVQHEFDVISVASLYQVKNLPLVAEALKVFRRKYYPIRMAMILGKELPSYYSRSKLCVLASLMEGKNRTLHEAASCNAPVVCFEKLNQSLRGETPVIAPGTGLTAQNLMLNRWKCDPTKTQRGEAGRRQPERRYECKNLPTDRTFEIDFDDTAGWKLTPLSKYASYFPFDPKHFR